MSDKTSRTIFYKMEGEEYQRFLRVSKAKGIKEANKLWLHLLAEADNKLPKKDVPE